jgi:hypothetical protein
MVSSRALVGVSFRVPATEEEEHRQMHTMTETEYKAVLTDQPHTVKVATARSDGRPHIAPVWFALDGDSADRAEEYGRRNGVAGELLVRVSPARAIAEADLTE